MQSIMQSITHQERCVRRIALLQQAGDHAALVRPRGHSALRAQLLLRPQLLFSSMRAPQPRLQLRKGRLARLQRLLRMRQRGRLGLPLAPQLLSALPA